VDNRKRKRKPRPPQCRPTKLQRETSIQYDSKKEGLIDICIPVRKRLEFTQLCFESLKSNTNWTPIGKVIIIHDDSDPEVKKYLLSQAKEIHKFDVTVQYLEVSFRSVVNIMKLAFDRMHSRYFLKIDNDVVIGRGYVNSLLRAMKIYTELVVLGYGKVYGDDFISDNLVVKKGLDYGYIKCINGRPDDRRELHRARFHVGGLVIVDSEKMKDRVGLMRGRDVFKGWARFQVAHLKEKEGEIGWYWPEIENTIILDFLGDKELFDKAGLDYDRVCELVDEYHKKKWSKRSLKYAMNSTQRGEVIWSEEYEPK